MEDLPSYLKVIPRQQASKFWIFLNIFLFFNFRTGDGRNERTSSTGGMVPTERHSRLSL